MPKGTPERFAGLGRAEPSPSARHVAEGPQPPASNIQRKNSWRADRRSIPAYLTVPAWKQLGQLSLDKDRSMSLLLIDGLDLLFRAHGLKTTSELGD